MKPTKLGKDYYARAFIRGDHETIDVMKERIKILERFMADVSLMLNCLPSYADPSLGGDNAHIKARIEHLLQIEEKFKSRDGAILGPKE